MPRVARYNLAGVSDDPKRPKGLDLSKLMKKRPVGEAGAPAAESDTAEAGASPENGAPETPAAALSVPAGARDGATEKSAEVAGEKKADLSKLLSKAKAKAEGEKTPAPEPEEPPPTSPPAADVTAARPPAPAKAATPPAAAKPATPAAKSTTTAKPAAVAKPTTPATKSAVPSAAPKALPAAAATPAKPAPPSAATTKDHVPPAPPIDPEAANAAAAKTLDAGRVARDAGVDTAHDAPRFVASVEDVASRAGAKTARFDYVVGDSRKYPRGFFGIDELYTQVLDWTNVCRQHAFRIPKRYRDGFAVHLETYGSIAYRASILWDGRDLFVHPGEHVGTALVSCRAEAEAGIDLVRGKLTCPMVSSMGISRSEGDRFLLWCLGLRRPLGNAAERQAFIEAEEEEFERIKAMRANAKDAIDYFCSFVERQCRYSAERHVTEPIFVRVTFEVSPSVEVLIHAEDGKLTVLRGKPGESLLQGAAELRFPQRALQPYFEGETTLFFLCRAGVVTTSGDLNVLPQLGLMPKDGVKMLQAMAKSQRLISPDNPFYVPMTLKVAPDPFGEEFEIP